MAPLTLDREIELKICKNCKGLDGNHFITTKRRCMICQRVTQPLEADFIQRRDEKGKKIPKGVKRFPRELAADKEQQIAVNIITEKCKDFDCPGRITEIRKGPVVTEYEFVPDRFTRLKKLKNLNEDLAMSLEAETVTIQRILGKGAIGVSVPNKVRPEIQFTDS